MNPCENCLYRNRNVEHVYLIKTAESERKIVRGLHGNLIPNVSQIIDLTVILGNATAETIYFLFNDENYYKYEEASK